MPFDTLSSLERFSWIAHAFTRRSPVAHCEESPVHQALTGLAMADRAYATAEQVHGDGVAEVGETASTAWLADLDRPGQPGPPAGAPVPGVDALITRVVGLPLVIRCADCAAVFLIDPQTPAIGLIHSGKRGTLANITGKTVRAMVRQFGSNPGRCLAALSPCIGPCHYELDLWTHLDQQLHGAGIAEVHNPRLCTACHLDRYYSYRAERGHTGRMYAVLALRPM